MKYSSAPRRCVTFMGNDLAHMDEQLDYSVHLLLDHALLRPRSQTD